MKHHGFSLIELLIVMALISILAAIGYPNYMSHLQRTECRRAKVALHQLATRMEHYAVLHGSYSGANQDTIAIDELQQHIQYQLQLTQVSRYHFTLTAIANKPQSDQLCNILSLRDDQL